MMMMMMIHDDDDNDDDDDDNNNNNYNYHYNNTAHVECKNKGDMSNNWSDWDHFQIIQKIRERHTRKP